MVAPEIAPPFWSDTVPVIAPVAPAWARRPAGIRSAINDTPRKTAIHFFILPIPPFKFFDKQHFGPRELVSDISPGDEPHPVRCRLPTLGARSVAYRKI